MQSGFFFLTLMVPCIVNIFLFSTTNKVQRYTIFFIIVNALHQRFSNCGPRTTSGPRVLPLWSF